MGRRFVVGKTNDLHVIDLAVGNVGGKFVAQRLFRRRADVGIEWMHISDERALRVGKIGDCAVVRVRARKWTVLIGDEARRQIMIGQPEQAEVSPVARVKFLAVQDEDAVSTRRVRIGTEIADVGHPLAGGIHPDLRQRPVEHRAPQSVAGAVVGQREPGLSAAAEVEVLAQPPLPELPRPVAHRDPR